jgi:plasmid stabilization system protein ParE
MPRLVKRPIVIQDRINIIRVLHGARNLESTLSETDKPE